MKVEDLRMWDEEGLRRALEVFPQRERWVLEFRVFDRLSRRAVAERFALDHGLPYTQERIRQIERVALKRLEALLSLKDLA